MTFTVSHNNAQIVLARPSFRSSKSGFSVGSSSDSGDSMGDDDYGNGGFGTEIMPHTKFIFVQHCIMDLQFFQGATKTYELLDDKGLRVFFGKEIPTTKKSTFVNGSSAEVTIHILDLQGEDVLIMEGHHGRVRTRSKFSVYLRGHKFLGEIIEKKKSCCMGLPSLEIMGRNGQKMIIKLSEESRKARGKFWKHWCGRSTIPDENLSFDIFLGGGKLRTRIGGIGLIGHFFPEIPQQLNNCVGVELHSDLSGVNKLLLVASIFMRNIPSNPLPEPNNFPNHPDIECNVEYTYEMNSGDILARDIKTETVVNDREQ